eukprot:TRINITY_DN29491_c0_g1_i1.p1 TRINITY_DN29491_c0_g1~~TRINITY_DN29491_c0_g1_i1.p1  ORF type:complete len:318 (+),score=78.47 TRINITY_DN29491_c0_g1_i1:37-954(+)
MEAILVNTLNGVEHLVCIDDAASTTGLQVEAISLFGFICRPADVRLAVDDIELEDDARLRDLAAVCEGCVIEATPTGTRYADAIHSGTLSLYTVPVWAQGLDECKIAAMEHRVVSERKKTLQVVSESGSSLKHAWPYLQRDKEIVMAAVRHDGSALQYASKQLRHDREVVLKAVGCGAALQHASEELQCDKGVVMEAVFRDGDALQYASGELRCDKELVLTAVSGCGTSLQYASTELRGDREVVLKAVLGDGLAIEYASEAIRADYGIALAAVKRTQDAFWKLPTSMRVKKNIRRAFMSRIELNN